MINIQEGTAEDREYINDKIIEYNSLLVPFTQKENFVNLDYVIKDNNRIIGGINALLYCWKCLYIDVLWVERKWHRKGLGAKLLCKAEDEAKKMGCHLSHLDTFDFQAKDFYLKNGYEIFGELIDCPPGHSRFYLRKYL